MCVEDSAVPQLYCYVPKTVADRVRRRAQTEGVSVSRYLAKLVTREMGLGWPEDFFEEVVGGWQGEPLQRPPQGQFEARDSLRP
jgi:hypothetical protein